MQHGEMLENGNRKVGGILSAPLCLGNWIEQQILDAVQPWREENGEADGRKGRKGGSEEQNLIANIPY